MGWGAGGAHDFLVNADPMSSGLKAAAGGGFMYFIC